MNTTFSLPAWRRILVAIGALLVLPSVFLPIWKIDFIAPQYPEGLALFIHADKLAGDVKIINGLNHYIGMRELHEDDFVEFTVLPYLLGGLSLLGLGMALINKKALYNAYAGLLVIFSVASLIDFYKWNYEYGHNLDPNAAIKVPGMSYQPPILGYKQILNFGVYSVPDIGGVLLAIGTALVLAGTLLIPVNEWMAKRKATAS
jgi:copper chaperone NosL